MARGIQIQSQNLTTLEESLTNFPKKFLKKYLIKNSPHHCT